MQLLYPFDEVTLVAPLQISQARGSESVETQVNLLQVVEPAVSSQGQAIGSSYPAIYQTQALNLIKTQIFLQYSFKNNRYMKYLERLNIFLIIPTLPQHLLEAVLVVFRLFLWDSFELQTGI